MKTNEPSLMFMGEAIKEAKKALKSNDVPVGVVIVKNGEIVGRGHNKVEALKDPTAHGEILAIRDAVRTLGNQRLNGCHMFVTLEPCAMCAGAIVLARLDKVTIGTLDKKSGACGSVFNIAQDNRLNHKADVDVGVLQKECEELIKTFFEKIRYKD